MTSRLTHSRDAAVRRLREQAATALWAVQAFRAARRLVHTQAPAPLDLAAPVGLGADRRHESLLVRLTLGVGRATCLERSLVRQAWWRAQGRRLDVIIGVHGGATTTFSAHAWLEGDRWSEREGFSSIRTVPCP